MKKKLFSAYCYSPERFVFRPLLSWRNTGILIAKNAGICVRIAAIFVLIQETSDRIDVTCGPMLVSVNAILLSREKTDTKELHEQNCAPIGGTSGATHVISGNRDLRFDRRDRGADVRDFYRDRRRARHD